MPRKGNGESLKKFKASVWMGTQKGVVPGQTVELEVSASTLVGACGRAAREGRKLMTKARFDMATINVETL